MVQTIDFSSNPFVGTIPETLGNCKELTDLLNLSQNNLSGIIPLQLGNIADLETLELSGVLPAFLEQSHQLQFLNVSFNNFTGAIPTVGVFKHLKASCFQGNPGLCGPIIRKRCMASSTQMHHHHFHLNWKQVLLIALSSSTAGALLLLLALCYSVHHSNARVVNQQLERLGEIKRYTAEELTEATQGYSDGNFLGEGALSMVYKGILSDGKLVAVKRFKDVCSRENLLKELRILSKLRHRNLVRILGCVLNLEVNALVLEFMSNGSLEHYMHNESYEWSWGMFMKTAHGLANALAYLHHEYGVPIIHGDVKPSNILLDSDLESHLADFGLAKLDRLGAISLSSNFEGSFGYMAPEYAYAARITTKVDVYSFGVVVLEMLTGQRSTQIHGVSLHECVKRKLLDGAGIQEVLRASLLPSVFDERETSSHNHLRMQLLQMGLACTEDNPDTRPSMQNILAYFIDIRKDHNCA